MATWGADARYTHLVEQHGTSLLHLAILLTGNRFDAEDVVQESLISVAGKWPLPTHPLAYLKKAVSNRAINLVTRRREVASDEIPDAVVEERGFLRREENERFFDLVRALPPRQRQTVVLRYYADLDDRAIASILGCSVSTVRSQAHHHGRVG